MRRCGHAKTVGAAEFEARSLNLIDQMQSDNGSIVITKRGRAVTVLSPTLGTNERKSILGAMKGNALRYDDPLSPA
ncbi:prevent-host-death protein [Rhizobium sp. NZLR1]|nr:prevent-host-death protein [Rhizobium sp. NZLR1]